MNHTKTTIFLFEALLIAVSVPALLFGDLSNIHAFFRFCVLGISIGFFMVFPIAKWKKDNPSEKELDVSNQLFFIYTMVASFLLANSMVDGVIAKVILTLLISAVLFIIPCCVKDQGS